MSNPIADLTKKEWWVWIGFFFYDIYGFISWKKRENATATPEHWELYNADKV